jgi:hypothetical protein
VQKKEKCWRDFNVGTKTGVGRMERKQGAECVMRREGGREERERGGERERIEHMWNGCSEMREKEIRWMKEIRRRTEGIKKIKNVIK